MKVSVRGFTLLELLIALGIFLLLAATVVPLTRGLFTTTQSDDATDTLVQALRTAQVRAQSGRNSSAHGVYFANSGYTLFQGGDYAGRDQSYDRVVDFGAVMTLSFDGGDEVVFAQGAGEPDTTGTVTLTHTESGTSTITIYSTGLIDSSP